MSGLSDINFLAVIVAGVAAFALGAAWYSKALFGKGWQKDLGFTDEYLQQGNMAVTFGLSLVAMIIMAFGMAWIMGGTATDGVSGLMGGLMIGVFFVGTSIAINYLYQRRSLRLWAIDALYQILFLGLMGFIIGAWQ